MNALNGKLLREFLKIAGDRLEGKWVLIGGTVLPLLGKEYRSTVDIHLAGPPNANQKDTIVLMEIAQELGLPVETINQAGAFFLFKIKDWEKKIVELHKGKTATFFRPNVELYFELKVKRMSETDLSDCLAFLSYCKKENESFDRMHLAKILKQELNRLKKEPTSAPRKGRIETLMSKLE